MYSPAAHFRLPSCLILAEDLILAEEGYAMLDISPPADALRLPAALAARICHDIAGPLGSLAGTLDMLAEDGDPEALAIARESASILAARLRLLRAAWAEDVEVPGTRIMQALVPGLPNAERLRVTLELDQAMAPALRRLGLNLLLLGSAALPRGGDIVLHGEAGALRLRVIGRNAAWPERLAACAAAGAAAASGWRDPRGLAVPMACLLAASQGLRIILLSETELTTSPA
jgi:histidine phosphotransferase ChpT